MSTKAPTQLLEEISKSDTSNLRHVDPHEKNPLPSKESEFPSVKKYCLLYGVSATLTVLLICTLLGNFVCSVVCHFFLYGTDTIVKKSAQPDADFKPWCFTVLSSRSFYAYPHIERTCE